MLYLFGFHRIGVALSDLYFLDPEPNPGQEGAERGVRLEVRLLEQPEHGGTIYASRPIVVDQPVWRADLLESASGPPRSFDRTHHHPGMRGWEPGSRKFEPELSADPLGWLAQRLSDLDGLLADAGLDPGAVDPRDASDLRRAVPEIVEAARRLLDGVHAGELAAAPTEPVAAARIGWL